MSKPILIDELKKEFEQAALRNPHIVSRKMFTQHELNPSVYQYESIRFAFEMYCSACGLKLGLKITQCPDSLRWYRNKLGQTVEYLGYMSHSNEYRSREPEGHINFVQPDDAELVVLESEHRKTT